MSQLNPDSDIKNNNMLDNGAVDTDLKSKSNILNDPTNPENHPPKEVLTEVTSIAEEEIKTGIEAKIPDAEELYSRAITSYIRHIKMLSDLVNSRNGGSYKISRKGMNRALISILQLPQDGLRVTLQNENEKQAFVLGQRIIADRYLATHYHIVQEKKRLQKEKEDANVTKTEEVSEKEGEVNEVP
jgi:hypothetical protein